MSVSLINLVGGVCVNNLSSRGIHAEIYQRTKCGGLFGNSCFSKRVNKKSRECCDAGNEDCWWSGLSSVDCDTDKRTKQGFGQTAVACAKCEINIYHWCDYRQ